MNKSEFKGMIFVVIAMIGTGLLLKYGEKLPLIKDARDGFGG